MKLIQIGIDSYTVPHSQDEPKQETSEESSLVKYVDKAPETKATNQAQATDNEEKTS